jgi:hypothetical protein
VELEQRRGLELRARDLLDALVQPVAHQAEGKRPVLDRPD